MYNISDASDIPMNTLLSLSKIMLIVGYLLEIS